MPVIATKTDVYSTLILDTQRDFIFNYNYTNTNAQQATATVYELGEILFYDGTQFRRVLDADVASLPTASSLPDDSPICVFVGDGTGIGRNVPLPIEATTDTPVSVAFAGPMTMLRSGLKFDSGISQANQALLIKQLEKQGIRFRDRAPQDTIVYHTVV